MKRRKRTEERGTTPQRQQRVKRALAGGDASFQLLFANNPLPMWVYDLQTLQFLEVNGAAVAHYGYTRDEFLKMRITDIRPPDDVGRLQEHVEGERPELQFSGVWRHTLKGGRVRDVDIVSHTLEYAGRKAALVISNDITERRQMEAALRKSEERYRLLAENVSDIIFVMGFDMKFTYASPSVAKVRGYTPEEAKEQTLMDVLTPSSLEIALKVFNEVMLAVRGGQADLAGSRTLQLELTRKDGGTVWVEVKMSFLRNKDGDPISILGIARDITERWQAEKALQESELRFRSVVQSAIDAIVLADGHGKIITWNTGAQTIFGYGQEEGDG